MSEFEDRTGSHQYIEVDEDPCKNCCRGFICCVCCCKYVQKSTRIKIIWSLLLLTATSSGIILGCVVFRDDMPLAAPSDMRPVTKRINYLFCEEVGIQSNGLHFDTYRVSGPLTIDKERRNLASFKSALFLENNDYDYYSFYFLPKSNLTLFQCTSQPVIFYVFQGSENFDAWTKDRDCEGCYLYKRYLQDSPVCEENSEYIFSLEIPAEDIYFIVYENQFGDKTWVDVNLFLDRSIYDLTDAISVCVDSSECSVDLTESGQTAVYQVASYNNLDEHSHSEFVTKCVPRVWSYLLFHIIFVLVLGITCSILVQKFCKNPDSERFMNLQANERTPLLYEVSSPPPYTTVILNPPKYDDAIRYSKPPSYSEVTSDMMTNIESQCRGPKEAENIHSDQREMNS